MQDIFSGCGTNRKYVAVRDNQAYADIRQECERLWLAYKDLADSHFVDQFSRDFDSRFWEMYLGGKLLRYYPDLQSSDSGPDFVVPPPNQVSVEATVATRGKGSDAVPSIAFRNDDDDSVPFEECILRVTSSLREKAKLNNISREDTAMPYVVAINLPYPEAWLCSAPPMVAMATLGVGGITIDLGTGIQEAGARQEIPKRSGQTVQATAFLSPEYDHVSALLIASVSPFSSSYADPAIELLHNPRCKNPLPRG